MRTLIYVPIIHTEADLGGLAEGIEERTRAVVGSINWQRHKEVVHLYWQEIANYWKEQDVSGLKIFQDGMMVNGIIGKNIVRSLVNSGSINHKIIEQLMEGGAELVQTEDPELLKEEYFLTRELTERKSLMGSLGALFRYRWQKDKLLKARDTYISKRINQSLKDEEVGVCFLGAYHQILPCLSQDIEVVPLKDPERVKEYSQKFLSGKSGEEVDKLGHYLTTPIQS